MPAALLTTLLFAISALCAYRTARQIGGVEANFWRICTATVFLGLWANLFGDGLGGAAFPIFVLSGVLGIGVGDSGYFQALPRLGSRRTVLLTQCLTAPVAALVEWLWLGTRLNVPEILCIAVILIGVVIALAPEEHLKIPARDLRTGILFSLVSALGGSLGAVLIRKAYAVAEAAGEHPDAGTTGYQRVLGGLFIPGLILLAVKWRAARGRRSFFEVESLRATRDKWRRLWPWLLANSLAGQTLGVTCMQWALKTTPTGIVTAVIATTPLALLPLTRFVEGEKIGLRPLLGALIAVTGVIGLALWY
ncbi:MAG: DMT family transporter [Verrucomicrobiota bacterium]|nr:DMT family transporter [Verrucomicrobiota bacterium]